MSHCPTGIKLSTLVMMHLDSHNTQIKVRDASSFFSLVLCVFFIINLNSMLSNIWFLWSVET